MRIDLVGTTADFRRFWPPHPLHVNHLLRKNSRAAGRIGEVRLGSMARYWMGIRITVLAGLAFPWATILINILGSLVIGFLATFTGPEGRLPAPLDARALLIVGLCGGFTTFSAFSLQTLDLARDGRLLLGGQYRAFRRAVSRRRRPRSLACHAFRQSMSAFRSSRRSTSDTGAPG